MALALCALSRPGERRRAARGGRGQDGRPNILVVMTDDMASADLELMPNVKKLLAKQGTTFADAVDSFPLCCPARATFITGQYAHNHDVTGNFYPYGWYGMKDRKNTLPAWLHKAGYKTALVGKWLNGYGVARRPRRGPEGLRHLARPARRLRLRLLQLRHEPGRQAAHLGRRRLRAQAGRVREASRSIPPAGKTVADDPRQAPRGLRPGALQLLGHREPAGLLARRHRHASPTELVKAQRKSKEPFFIWWSPAAPHREDVATTLMGRPGPDPRPPPRYAAQSKSFTAAAAAELQRGGHHRQVLAT